MPELLREILESTLSQEASQESLDKYLPKIRDIIIALLHGLKRKQQKLRQKQSRDLSHGDKGDGVPRQNSTSSIGSAGTGVTTLLNEGIDPNHMPHNYQIVDGKVVEKDNSSHIPPRGSSMNSQRGPPQAMPQRDISRGSLSSDQSTLSSTTMQNIPVLPPYPGDETTMPVEPKQPAELDNFPPPPPPPKQSKALAELQSRGDLERRASRRFSTYQLTKHLGSQAPMPMPAYPAQNARVPNRGRDLREGLNAVRGRQSAIHGHSASQSTSRLITEDTINRVPSRVSERDEGGSEHTLPPVPPDDDSPMVKTPVDKLRQEDPAVNEVNSPPELPESSATLSGPAGDAVSINGLEGQPKSKYLPQPERAGARSPTTYAPSEVRESFVPEQSPQPGKELTLFLQYKTKIKKFVMADGYNDLSMARLQLAFIEKFAWNTHNNGVDLPEIYIQDPISGVRHELEDLNDIKDRSVLVLNVEALDEVKRHIDEGLGDLRKLVEGVQTAVEDQKLTMQRVSERQQDTVKEMSRLQTAPPSARTSFVPEKVARMDSKSAREANGGSKVDIGELQTLRRDLAVVRQTFNTYQSDMDHSMSGIRQMAGTVKTLTTKAAEAEVIGDSGRQYVSAGKKTLIDDSDALVGRVDDLQDIVEDLRKDVVMRGVRPLPRQLEEVAKDLSVATHDLRKIQELLKRERPIWTKIWEKELETVCNEREELTMQEDLAADLQDDLEKAMGTFALVEQATKEQMKEAAASGAGPVGARTISRGLNHVPDIDPYKAKDGVLGEVRALQPNHESRLEAIERAEKLRQKDLESRTGGEFQKELGDFVEDGKLKKSGGFEEVERIRKARDEKIRREVWERQNGMTQADQGLEMPSVSDNFEGLEEEDGVETPRGETPRGEENEVPGSPTRT